MPAVIPAAAAIGGALISSNGAKKAAQTQADAITEANKQDPRIEAILHGQNGQGGLLSQFQGMLNTPRSDAATGFAGANSDYLKNFGGADLGAVRGAAMQAMGGNSAPMAQAAQSGATGAGLNAYAVGNMVDAPSQNNINLTPTFQSMLAGGDTSKLMGSLQAGNALAGAQFQQNQSNLTDNLQRNILPGIRSNSVLAGQYGGSRQGVAEGLAMSDITKQLNNSNTQFGLGAAAANSAALASNYENGQNRALSAAQGLGAQQYATAFKDADTKNAAEFTNVGNMFDLGKFNASLQQQNSQFNAGLQQQAGLANQGAQLATNAQNNGSLLGGAGLLSGLLSQVQGSVNANDNWGLNRAQGVNALLAPYLSRNPTGQVAPASNSAAAGLGGAMAGLSLGNSLAGMFGNSSTPTSTAGPYSGAAAGNGIMAAFPKGGY